MVEIVSQRTGAADPLEELRRLRRELRRERARRQAAESAGGGVSSELHDSVRDLRSAQGELLERADQARVVSQLARSLRQDLDSAQLVNRAAESVGLATGVDRCDVLLVDANLYSALHGSWSRSSEHALLPRPRSFVEMPEALNTLLLESAQQLDPLKVEDVELDPRLEAGAGEEILEALGVRAVAATPIAVGDEVMGWLLLQSVGPRTWQSRELAICDGVAHDLVSSLIQVRAFEQQRESMRRLEELDRAKDAFISSVSHELRTPLTSIVGYLEMITEGGLGAMSEEVAQGMAIIERNAFRLRDLVEDLLALSAYDASQMPIDLQEVNLVEVVDECRQALVPAAAGREIEVVVDLGEVLPVVQADRTQMERVVLNLLSNAVKFSHDGGRITIGLHAEADAVVLTVSDAGIGIPAAEQDRLFSRFFRSSLSVADEIQGTGLGLALVRSAVEGHRGTVEVDSAEGEGTTVTVRLPATDACAGRRLAGSAEENADERAG